jgi:hypothetical protein
MGAAGSRRGIGPLLATYWTFGGFWGVWAVIFADFLRQHGLSPGELSLQFVGLSATAILVMTFVAPRLETMRRGASIGLGLGVHALGAALVAVLPTFTLVVGFTVVGLGTGIIDVFVNSAAHEIELASGRSALQWVHAFYGVGGVTGGLGAGVALTLGADPDSLLLVTAVAQAAVTMWVLGAEALRIRGAAGGTGQRVTLAVFLARPALLLPGLVVLSAFFIEGSMDVWSVIFLRRTLGASVMAGAVGFAAFAAATATGRAFAARVLFDLGYRRTIVISASGSMLSGAFAVLTSSPVVASVAFLVLGFSLSAASPAAFGLAGSEGGGRAIAAVTTVGYTGFVIGPPILGWLADAVSLRATMVAVVVATVGVAAGALGRGTPDRMALEPERGER